MAETKADLAVENSGKSETQQDAPAEVNTSSTKGRRSSAGKPKVSRIMKDVQEGEALLKQMGHKEESNEGRRTTRSSTRSGGAHPTPPPPVKRQRRSGSSSNNSIERKKSVTPPATKVKSARAGRGRGRGRPKKSDADKEENSEEEEKDEGNHIEDKQNELDTKDMSVSNKEEDIEMEEAEDGAEKEEAKLNDVVNVPSDSAPVPAAESPKKTVEESNGNIVDVDVNAKISEENNECSTVDSDGKVESCKGGSIEEPSGLTSETTTLDFSALSSSEKPAIDSPTKPISEPLFCNDTQPSQTSALVPPPVTPSVESKTD